MNLPENLTAPLLERLETYLKTSIQLLKLRALETSIAMSATLLTRLSVALISLLFLLLFSIGVALYLGEMLGKIYYGFFSVAGFYLLTGLVFHRFLHQWIRKPVGNFIITHSL
jgi:hypothetical protein